MKMKKLLLLSAFLFVGSVAFSQFKLEYGGMLGAANYLGEIGGKEKTPAEPAFFLRDAQDRPRQE